MDGLIYTLMMVNIIGGFFFVLLALRTLGWLILKLAAYLQRTITGESKSTYSSSMLPRKP